MSNCIFEIFSEEIPATLQKKIYNDYKIFTEKELRKLSVSLNKNDIKIGITLNRIVLILNNCEISKQQLTDFITTTLKDFSHYFPRTMCYPQSSVRWIRPIRNIFACIDNNILNGEFFGIKTNNGTFIQKFLFSKSSGYNQYLEIIKNEGIELNFENRVKFVKSEIEKENTEYTNSSLIEEIAGMSEYCIEPMKSELDDKYNILPFELIELVLRENQRYVVFKPDKENKIKFLIFGDKISSDITKRDNILKGHRKVISARLDDAVYYWQLDEKIKNNRELLYNSLKNKIFLDDISWEKYLNYQQELANQIIEDDTILQNVKKLIIDTKLDLATGVVEEFPELQGIIGGYYFNYKINPYKIDMSIEEYNIEELYYYIIDRLSYIFTMYKNNKQPTSSGDKYKVKARIDDIVSIFVNNYEINFNNFFHQNDSIIEEIKKLFVKRYQKYIEDNYNYVKNIKQFIEASSLILFEKRFNIKLAIKSYGNDLFIKTYKRIHGYVKDLKFEENDVIINKSEEIFKMNDNYESINNYLDNNQINNNDLVKKTLKYIENKYFEHFLPSFLI